MDLAGVVEVIDEASKDPSFPMRIRKLLQKISADLIDESTDQVMRVTTAVYEVETVVDDINIPMYAKTILWDIISDLESVKE